MKHTPGPWKVLNPNKSTNYIVSDKKGANGRLADTIEMLADARLIAAAPEMLEALQKVAPHLRDYDADLFIICKTAVAKATGGK